jgi:hypothetical protein
MAAQVTHHCEQCTDNACPDQVVVYDRRFREYGLPDAWLRGR